MVTLGTLPRGDDALIPLDPQKVQLENGRILAYTQFGDPEGRPVFFFHGWPGARLQGAAADPAGKKLGVRIIAIDRPGFGQSDFQPKRTLLDWPDDVSALAHKLNISQFSVLGLSGGGPYALACAYKLPPEQLLGTAVVCGAGPSDTAEEVAGFAHEHQKIIGIIRKAPWLMRIIFWNTVRKRMKNMAKAMDELIATLPEPDQIALSGPEAKPLLIASATDSFSPGVKGHTLEMLLFASAWHFSYEEITAPVQLWHGEADTVISIDVSKRAAKRLPNSQVEYFADEGHYSIILNQTEPILSRLIAT